MILGISIFGLVMIVLAVILVIALVVWVVKTYNNFIMMRNNAEEAFSTMDIYLKKRYDLIPNLVETVKGFAKHENETLENVMKARYNAMNSATVEQRIDNENVLQGALKSLFAVTENYPTLQANANFQELQATLRGLEEEIASSRKYYNGTVNLYNTKRETFPQNIIAKMFKFVKKPLYEVDAPEERKNVKVSFD